MSRRAAHVTQADIARAIRAARQEGLHPIRIVLGKEGATVEVSEAPDIHSEEPPEENTEPLGVIY